MNDIKFPCDKCGKCCRNLQNVALYDDLNRGDGICKNLDTQTNLCTIYDTRPLKCRIIDSYALYSDQMSFENYISINQKSCKILKEK